MADLTNSYDFTNSIRDVSQLFNILVQSKQVFFKYLPMGAAPLDNKHEWINQRISPLSSAITTIATPTATTIVVADGGAFKAGDICECRSSDGEWKEELVLVTAVSTNTLTVTRTYGSTTSTNFVVGDILYPIDSRKENSTASATDNYEGTADYNYTQIFRDDFTISRTASQSRYYDMANETVRLAQTHMQKLMWQINRALLSGERVARSGATSGITGSLRGILRYIGASGGNIKDASSSAITLDMFNDVWEAIYSDGGQGGNFMVLCAENQARKISGFNTSGTNPIVMTTPDDMSAGTTINMIRAAFLPDDGSYQGKIVIDPMMPKDRIAIINLNDVELNVMQPMGLVDATTPGQDGITQRLLTELTLTVKNPLYSHGLIKGLTV